MGPPRAAARNARRIVDSPSASSSEASATPPPSRTTTRTARGKRPLPRDESDGEDELAVGEEDDAVGEEDDGVGEIVLEDDQVDAEGEEDMEMDFESEGEGIQAEQSRVSSAPASEDMDMDEDEDELDEDDSRSASGTNLEAPSSALKIKFKVGGGSTPTQSGRPGRAAAKKGAKKVKRVAEDEFDSDDELLLKDDVESVMSSRRSISPSRLTARQRAKGDKNLQETLMALPSDQPGKKQVVLTEAERQEKREETARRRKRQSEQKLQDEQDETINRLLRAQTSRSRSKLDNPVAGEGETSGQVTPVRRTAVAPSATIRWSSTLTKEGDVLLRVAAPKQNEDWISITPASSDSKPSVDLALCAVQGCGERRKYRSTRKFEVGGCSLPHLKAVEAAL